MRDEGAKGRKGEGATERLTLIDNKDLFAGASFQTEKATTIYNNDLVRDRILEYQ